MSLIRGDGQGVLLPNSIKAKNNKNVCIESYKILVVKKALTKREFLPLMCNHLPNNKIPGAYIALIRGKIFYNEILNEIIKRTEKRTINDIQYKTRYSIRNEKKQPWSIKTRAPFRGKIDNVKITFKDKIKLAEKVTQELGAPYEQSKRGAPPTYDLKKVTATLLIKGMTSFSDLSSKIKEIEYIMTIDKSEKYPCSSILHYTFEKIPKRYLEKAVERLDELSVECFLKFEEDLNTFVTDNSAITCETLKEKTVTMKPELHREFHKYMAVTRNHTNTVRCVKKASNKIKEFLPHIPKGSLLLADAEFDVEENYKDAHKFGIELQVKLKNHKPRKSFRKQAKRDFDKKKYSKRKLGERYFGNLESRRFKCYFRKTQNREKFTVLMACDHNITEYFKNKVWCDLFIRL